MVMVVMVEPQMITITLMGIQASLLAEAEVELQEIMEIELEELGQEEK